MNNEIKPFRLLVVEDNPGDYVLLEQYFKRSQLPIEKIFHAGNMAVASTLVKDNFFDIALLDLTLPDSTGIESVITLCRLLPKTPIVVFSGLSTIEIAIESISLGAQDYLVKGEFDEKLLAKSVQYSIERKRITEKLRISNERYEFVNKATQDTIWEWDYAAAEGRWGEGLINTFGYSRDKLIYNESWVDEYIHPNDKKHVEKRIQISIESGMENWQDEYRFRCADGSYKYVYDRGFILFDEQGNPYRMFGAMTDVTEKKRLEGELAEQQIKLQKLITETNIQAQEKERSEFGTELHDNISQILVTVKLFLGMVKSNPQSSEDLVEKSLQHVNEAIEEIRKLSHSLAAPALAYIGLNGALQKLAGNTKLYNNLNIQLLVDENFNNSGIDKNKELILFRIVQEQLRNITNYANAKKAVITLKAENGNLFLTVSDNGVGFDTKQKSNGFGLKNISSRVEFYSGNMKIISAPGQGCTLEVNIPW